VGFSLHFIIGYQKNRLVYFPQHWSFSAPKTEIVYLYLVRGFRQAIWRELVIMYEETNVLHMVNETYPKLPITHRRSPFLTSLFQFLNIEKEDSPFK
jgi:hypothetical protein